MLGLDEPGDVLRELPKIDFFPPDFLDFIVAAGLITNPVKQ